MCPYLTATLPVGIHQVRNQICVIINEQPILERVVMMAWIWTTEDNRTFKFQIIQNKRTKMKRGIQGRCKTNIKCTKT